MEILCNKCALHALAPFPLIFSSLQIHVWKVHIISPPTLMLINYVFAIVLKIHVLLFNFVINTTGIIMIYAIHLISDPSLCMHIFSSLTEYVPFFILTLVFLFCMPVTKTSLLCFAGLCFIGIIAQVNVLKNVLILK